MGVIMLNKVLVIFIIFFVSSNFILLSETNEKVFLKYEKPLINRDTIIDFITNNGTLNVPINHKFSILLTIYCDSSGFITKLKYDKLLTQTSSNLDNNEKFWYYLENQLIEVSKVWQINLENLKYFRICDELLKENEIQLFEYHLCKKSLLERNSFEIMLIFKYNSRSKIENSVKIIHID